LKSRGVGPISIGGVIVATWEPHETVVLETIRDRGLDLQVIFNKGAVRVLPSNVNKATGLLQAAKRMGLSPHNVVGVGDAENDHAFLSLCECSAAVANALPAVKQTADIVLQKDHGAGVVELIDDMVTNDLRNHASHLSRRDLVLGKRPDGVEERIPVYGTTLLIAGPSGSGKSTVATSLLERMMQHKYQFCIVDPEGDYEGLEGAVVLGSAERGPVVDEVLHR
jgi:hydroxymethylpyrimidine pyrophosphatase-like HAD family hydrolase